MQALLSHRVSHALHEAGVPVVPRALANVTKVVTGVEIHPAAQIGRGLFIDHGAGVVIGETAEVGDNVTLYQGVTLGGTGFQRGKRHPDGRRRRRSSVRARSCSARSRWASGAKVGANSVVIHDVPADSTVVGNPGHPVRVDGRRPRGAGRRLGAPARPGGGRHPRAGRPR